VMGVCGGVQVCAFLQRCGCVCVCVPPFAEVTDSVLVGLGVCGRVRVCVRVFVPLCEGGEFVTNYVRFAAFIPVL